MKKTDTSEKTTTHKTFIYAIQEASLANNLLLWSLGTGLGYRQGEREELWRKRQEESFGDDEYVYPLDCNDVFISTHNQNLSNCAFKYMQYADYNSLNPFKKKTAVGKLLHWWLIFEVTKRGFIEKK